MGNHTAHAFLLARRTMRDRPTLPTAPPWSEQAECAQTGINDEVWFPHGLAHNKVALAMCHRCPVAAECLDATLEAEADPEFGNFRWGIFGGTTPQQREQIAKRRAA